MQIRPGMMLNAFLNYFHRGSSGVLLSVLPKERAEILAKLSIPSSLPLSLFNAQTALEQIHYSWLGPHIQEQAPELQQILISSLSSGQGEALNKHLSTPTKIVPLAGSVQQFFSAWIYKHVIPEGIFPVEFLQTTALLPLLSLDKSWLVQLMDLLGIHALAASLRKVVDRRVHDLLQPELTANQRQYLQHCMQQSSLYFMTADPVEKWLEGVENTRRKIHLLGINYLAQTLVTHEESFLWHLSHRFDSGRGGQLNSRWVAARQESIPEKISQQMVGGVVALIAAFQQSSTREKEESDEVL